jgi:PAS domain S-box-containing protein
LISFLENAADQIAIALVQRQTQAALESSEERYRGLFENMAEGYAYCRMIFENGEPRDWLYLAVNASFATLTGMKDAVGKRVSEVIPGIRESDPELFAAYARVSTTGKPEKFERYVEALKSWYHVSVYSPEKEFFIAVFDVITDRKNAEIALRKSEELFSKAFHGSPLAMVITSLVDRRIIDVNEAFEKITGFSREAVIGHDFRSFGLFVDAQALEQAMQAVVRDGKYHGFEFEIRTRSGKHCIARLSSETAGEPCSLTVAEDITDRKNAEIALRKSENLFSKAFHGSPVAMAISSMLDRRIIDVNDAFERQSGYSRDEIIGRTPLESMIMVDSAEVERLTRILIADGNIHDLESPYRTRSGELRLALFSAEIVDVADKPCILTVAEDITERKRAVEALQLSEERFRLMFDNMSNGMYFYEAVEDGAEFLIKELNPAAERIGKVKRAEVIGRPVSRFFPALKEIGLFQMFQRVWRTGIGEHQPACFYRDDRFSVWVENYVFKLPSGEVVAIVDDITDRKFAETELRKSETWHRSLIELGVSVYIVLDEKRRIHYASPLLEKVLGWMPEDFFRKSIFEFVASTDAEAAARFFAEILHAPRRKKRMHARLRCKNGDLKVLEIFGVNLLDEPAVQGIVLSTHDITEQVHAQERVDAFRTELAHASRLAAMGALTAGIAHEINQPLSIMATWAEVAAREIRDNLSGDKQEALLALMRIDAAMERSGDIMQRMKDFARKSEPRVTAVSLAEAIEGVRLLVDHQLRFSGVALSVEIDRAIPPVLADRIQVQQVLMNLILNAVEAMESIEPPARRVEIGAKAGDGMLEIAVSDSGRSISPDRLESVFEPFHSTKPEGLGLGLSICRTIIQWHGGRIWAARNAERGTTVTFTLPLAKEKHRHATETNDLYRGRRTRSS